MVWQQENRLNYEDFLQRHQLMTLLFAALFLVLSLRLFHLQVIRGNYYRNQSEQQRTHIVVERAARGLIYDCRGDMMVRNKTGYVALFYPFAQGAASSKAIVEKLHAILKRDLGPAIIRGWRSGQAVRLANDLTRDEMFRLQEQRLVLPGISVVNESRRDYKLPEANAHLVGYLNEVTTDDLEDLEDEGYKSGDWIGRNGLEKQYDAVLRGQDGGWQIEVDALGHQTRMVKRLVPLMGSNVHTTIDLRLQQVAYEELLKSPTGRGAVVALDPRTGAVRALVSTPGFDPNRSFTHEFSQYLKGKDLPLFNRATQGLYAPGSTFKIITFSAAVNEDKINLAETFDCTGKFVLGNKTFACWLKTGHGPITLIPALINSCNVYFYQLGLRLGVGMLGKYARMYHLGEKTGIDLPSEKRGLVPDIEWKRKKMREGWQQGDTANMAIGQGYLWVTPLQMALTISAVANGGTFYKPYIVSSVSAEQGETISTTESTAIGSIELSEKTWRLLRGALEGVVKIGTGRGCAIANFPVAGKTGTAQNPHGNDHAWFVCYGPVADPALAIAVIVENGGHGGTAAVPIARRMFETYYEGTLSTATVAGVSRTQS
ncbi:MAG: penicillin-binding protein 2 [Elusimicrobia bacterium]|nr:penicillin-binding protein 2 [Elusimicrobiota bacterium]